MWERVPGELPLFLQGLLAIDLSGHLRSQLPLDLSRSLPATAQIHGYDISDRLFPPAEWLPSNVTLSKWDALSEVPEHMKGQYDIVHVRFLLTIVADNDPSRLARNLIEMLSTFKPAPSPTLYHYPG